MWYPKTWRPFAKAPRIGEALSRRTCPVVEKFPVLKVEDGKIALFH